MNEKVNMHIKFSGFVGFDKIRDARCRQIRKISKGRELLYYHRPFSKEQNFRTKWIAVNLLLMVISPNLSLRNLVLGDAFVHFLD